MAVRTFEPAGFASQTDSQGGLGRLLLGAVAAVQAYVKRQALRAELEQLDDRILADLGLTRGDFPAILAGTFRRS